MGILLAMPFGPINLLGIQRAVERGFFGGMAAGIGIMAGDGLIALGAALGVNAISGAIRQYRTVIQIVGGVALLGFGIRLYLARAAVATEAHAEKASLRDYIWDIPQMFILTLTNPAALLGLIAIFGGVSSFVEVESYIDALTMVAAIGRQLPLLVRRVVVHRHHPPPPGRGPGRAYQSYRRPRADRLRLRPDRRDGGQAAAFLVSRIETRVRVADATGANGRG
jgi:threonine/homoserine/homoserine lactone efflux protein